jgi:hypothetical protein
MTQNEWKYDGERPESAPPEPPDTAPELAPYEISRGLPDGS